MNLHQHPDLLQTLAASYALGTLRGGARRRFEAQAREHPAVRAAALLWQTHWAGLTELQAPEPPPAAVWMRIDNLVQAERAALRHQANQANQPRAVQASAPRWWRRLALWQGAAAGGAFATLVAVVVAVQVTGGVRESAHQQIASLQTELAARGQTTHVAVLRDDKAHAELLVTFDAQAQKLHLQQVGGFAVPPDRSLQLWALPAGGKPRSLGVLAAAATQALPAAAGQVQGVPMLAISLEPKGGVPSEGGPTGPVLFTGEWIQKTV